MIIGIEIPPEFCTVVTPIFNLILVDFTLLKVDPSGLV